MISIVIPCNGRICLANALQSIERSETTQSYEIIVVGVWPEALDASLFPQVTFIPAPEGTSTGSLRNTGILRSKGTRILFTDSDCIVDPDWLDQLSSSMTELDGAMAGGIRFPENNRWDLGDNLAIFHRVHTSRPAGEAKGHIGTNNLCVWKSVLDAVHGFDETLTVGEDADLLARIRQAGHRIGFAPHAAVLHKSGRNTAAAVREHARWYGKGYVMMVRSGHAHLSRWRLEQWCTNRLVGIMWSSVKAAKDLLCIVLPHPAFWPYMHAWSAAWLFLYWRRITVFDLFTKSSTPDVS